MHAASREVVIARDGVANTERMMIADAKIGRLKCEMKDDDMLGSSQLGHNGPVRIGILQTSALFNDRRLS